MTPEQLCETQWIATIRGQIVTPHEAVSTCSNGGRLIDFVVISPCLAQNVEPQQSLSKAAAFGSSSCQDQHSAESSSDALAS